MNEIKWWGYVHENGNIQVKRWFGENSNLDIQDARESPFCGRVFTAFLANSREEAIDHISSIIKL